MTSTVIADNAVIKVQNEQGFLLVDRMVAVVYGLKLKLWTDDDDHIDDDYEWSLIGGGSGEEFEFAKRKWILMVFGW